MRALRSSLILIVALFSFALSAPASAQLVVSVGVPPPALPIYTQPPAPAPNYLWTPGYWAWGPAGYYWVPGTWVAPPRAGLLWTPGYWGWRNTGYGWNPGYWASGVGFYGGINYGYGYPGTGFSGGRWTGNQFYYNTAIWPVNRTVIRTVYVDRTVVRTVTVTRTSYNGGRGGVIMRPNAQQLTILRVPHVPMTSVQVTHVRIAEQDRTLRASVNHGKPTIAATAKPLTVTKKPVVAPAKAPANTPVQPKPTKKPNPKNTKGKPPA